MTDRRVKYTKMVLRDSLIGFLDKKPISRITVKELCEDADVNRATYYAHFRDQFDQLQQVEEEFLRDIREYVAGFAADGVGKNLLMAEKIFEYIFRNNRLCSVLLGENGDINFQQDLIDMIRGIVIDVLSARDPAGRETAEYALTFIATGSIGVVRRWLAESGGQTPRDIARLVLRLAEGGIEQLGR